MPEDSSIDPQHRPVRTVLRVVGPLILAIAAIFVIVALVDVCMVMNAPLYEHRQPTKFWGFFVGFPLGFIGLVMTYAAYVGRIARYMSQEVMPPTVDTLNYAAGETRGAVRELAEAVGEGLGVRNAAAAAVRAGCPKCRHENEADAQFCSHCGAALPRTVLCAACRHPNAPDARFCDRCGHKIGR